jgi:cytosine/adenosine deaminase-related metal-dependent hydrolase
MRGDDDHRKDYLVKKDILDRIQKHWTVVHAVDDNPAVIQLWEENGIPTTIIEGWDEG